MAVQAREYGCFVKAKRSEKEIDNFSSFLYNNCVYGESYTKGKRHLL